MTKILFVCHGNICRSPMAEFIFKKMVKDLNLEKDFYISSAATSTEEICFGRGNPVYPPAREELLKHGITCTGKTARQITEDDYSKYDLLIAMDNYNVQNMNDIIGNDFDNKIHKLLEYTGSSRDVADPWYTGNFDKTYTDIYNGCQALLKKLTT